MYQKQSQSYVAMKKIKYSIYGIITFIDFYVLYVGFSLYNTNVTSYINGYYYGENGISAEQEFIINFSTSIQIILLSMFIFLILLCVFLIEYKTKPKNKKK